MKWHILFYILLAFGFMFPEPKTAHARVPASTVDTNIEDIAQSGGL